MSMQELPDDQLDELFRKSAEEFEPTFDPSAWEAMRRKLDDNEDRVVGGWSWPQKTGAALLGLLLLVGIGYWWQSRQMTDSTPQLSIPAQERVGATSPISSQKQKDALTESNSAKRVVTEKSTAVSEIQTNDLAKNTTPTPATTPTFTESEAVKKNTKKTSLPENTSTRTEKVAAAVKNPTNANGRRLSTEPANDFADRKTVAPYQNRISKKTSRNNRKQVISTNEFTQNQSFESKNRVIGSKKPNVFEPQSPTGSAKTPTEQTNTSDIQTAPNEPLATSEPTRLVLADVSEMTAKPWQLMGKFTPPVSIAYTPPTQPLFKPTPPETPPVFGKGLSVRIATTPDISYITMPQMTKQMPLGWSAMLEYRFSRRLSVQAGVFRSLKTYTATGEQYIWPQSWYGQTARPVSVGADCKVLDIPINLRFDLNQGTRSRWFVSSGISSYKMLNEKYAYTYPPHTYNIKWKSWEGTTGSYWFGVLNLGVGFEHRIAQRWSVQAEPFFKVPLAQVGMGKIKLHTTGAFVSLRYKLPRF